MQRFNTNNAKRSVSASHDLNSRPTYNVPNGSEVGVDWRVKHTTLTPETESWLPVKNRASAPKAHQRGASRIDVSAGEPAAQQCYAATG